MRTHARRVVRHSGSRLPRLEWLESRHLPSAGAGLGEFVRTWTHEGIHGPELADLIHQQQDEERHSSADDVRPGDSGKPDPLQQQGEDGHSRDDGGGPVLQPSQPPLLPGPPSTTPTSDSEGTAAPAPRPPAQPGFTSTGEDAPDSRPAVGPLAHEGQNDAGLAVAPRLIPRAHFLSASADPPPAASVRPGAAGRSDSTDPPADNVGTSAYLLSAAAQEPNAPAQSATPLVALHSPLALPLNGGVLALSSGTPTGPGGSAGLLVPLNPSDSPSPARPGAAAPGSPDPVGRADLPAPAVEANDSRAAAGAEREEQAPPGQGGDLVEAPAPELSGLGQGLRDLVRRAAELIGQRPALSALALGPLTVALSATLLYGLDCRRRRRVRSRSAPGLPVEEVQ